MSKVDRISESLSDLLGRVCCASDSSNGRKLPVYLPEDDQEYLQVLEKLCDGKKSPSNKSGSSVISIGPLGCKDNGIVIHPDSFKDSKEYEYVLRKEMARYAYLSSLDFNEAINHQSWFTEGFVEYFARGVDTLSVFSNEMIDSIEKNLLLNEEEAQGKIASPQIGAAFLLYFSDSQGAEKFSEFIQESFKGSLDSAFVSVGVDFQKVKADWIQSLRGMDTTEEIIP